MGGKPVHVNDFIKILDITVVFWLKKKKFVSFLILLTFRDYEPYYVH